MQLAVQVKASEASITGGGLCG